MAKQLSLIPKDEDLVSVAQAAESLGYSKMTIYRWFRAHKIAGRLIAGFLFIRKSEVDRLQNEEAPLAKGAPGGKIGGEQ